jgi:hypothetical protein
MKYQILVIICRDLLCSFLIYIYIYIVLVINEYYTLVSSQFFILTRSLHKIYKT